jgi:hypothetical protein
MTWFVAGVVVLAPAIQVLLMGVIGYPAARKDPAKLAAFERSGFTWWLVTLVLIAFAVAALSGLDLDAFSPSQHDHNILRLLIVGVIAAMATLAIEAIGEAVRIGRARAADDRARYESVLPDWARPAAPQAAVLTLLGTLEEFLYRGALLVAVLELGGAKPLAAGISAAAFGLAHLYFGPRQVVLKALTGSVLVSAAFAGGWVAAALAHVAMNLTILAMERRGG